MSITEEKEKDTPKKKRQATLAQFVAIIVLSTSIFLIVDFGRRAAANYRVQREAERLSEEVEVVRRRQNELLAWRDYVASDPYVIETARKELKWARTGETVIVILPTPRAESLPGGEQTPTAATPPLIQTPAQRWWSLFFGEHVP